MFRVGAKIRVGRETGNTDIYFFFAQALVSKSFVCENLQEINDIFKHENI